MAFPFAPALQDTFTVNDFTTLSRNVTAGNVLYDLVEKLFAFEIKGLAERERNKMHA